MSERFQKTFISAREFVESWDKEIYELTNLDFFIYLMINHLGNQLEKRYFVRERKNSSLFLPFENLGNLCFNLGDSFEYFVEDNCFNGCSLGCLTDLNGLVDPQEFADDPSTSRRISLLQAFLSDRMTKEQCLRVDLMNNVILDTLLHFYAEEMGLEVDETDLEVIQLADFIENVLVDFIRNEGQSLLHRPYDPAMDYFEELLETEDDYSGSQNWLEEDHEWHSDESSESWQNEFEDISTTLERFVSDYGYHSPDNMETVATDIELFKEYLIEYADIHEVYEINEEHFLEFFSYWLIQKFVLEDENYIPQVFRTVARFVTWLFNNYGLDYKKVYLLHYENVKTEVPRVVKALNMYLNEYDMLEALLTRGKQEVPQISGFFEIQELHSRKSKRMDVVDVHYFDQVKDVYMNSSAYLKLRKGDIIQATLVKKDFGWEVLEIQFIFPRAAKPFLH